MAQEEYTTTRSTAHSGSESHGNHDEQSVADNAKQKAQDATATAKQGANNIANTAREGAAQAKQEASRVASGLKNEAAHVASDMREQAQQRAESQKDQAADRLSGMASALRETSSNFRNQDEEVFAQYADSAADQVDRFSGYLREQNVGDLVHDVKQMAKRQPELFVVGALAAGFFLGRFLKSADGQQQLPTQYRGGYPSNSGAYRSTYAPSGSYASGGYNTQYGTQYGETGYDVNRPSGQYTGGQTYAGQEAYTRNYSDPAYGSQQESREHGQGYGTQPAAQSASQTTAEPQTQVSYEPKTYAAASVVNEAGDRQVEKQQGEQHNDGTHHSEKTSHDAKNQNMKNQTDQNKRNQETNTNKEGNHGA